jgi:hypothetical protein
LVCTPIAFTTYINRLVGRISVLPLEQVKSIHAKNEGTSNLVWHARGRR